MEGDCPFTEGEARPQRWEVTRRGHCCWTQPFRDAITCACLCSGCLSYQLPESIGVLDPLSENTDMGVPPRSSWPRAPQHRDLLPAPL